MPTYDYECTKCSNKFEFFQSMKDKPLSKCPKCKSPVKRLISNGAGIIFKGSGFYATDYKLKDSKSDSKACPKANGDNSACKNCQVSQNNK